MKGVVVSVNSVVLTGRLTRDPELKTVGADNRPVCKFGLAVDEFSKGEKRANFFDVVAWGQTAETVARYLTKGREVAVAGSLRWRQWETPEGQKRSAVEIVAQRVQFFGGQQEGAAPQSAPQTAPSRPVSNDEDIPF
jgi:single-strand DNA-binding protein